MCLLLENTPYASIPRTLTKVGTMMTCHHHPRYEETNTYGNLNNSWENVVLLMCQKSIGQLFYTYRFFVVLAYTELLPLENSNAIKCFQIFSNLLLEKLRLTTTNYRT
jgi:hypothetical protein